MSFVFSLKSLLRVREIHEEAELQKLRTLVAQHAAAQAEIISMDAAVENDRREICAATLGGVSAAEWQFHALRERLQAERRQALLQKLQDLERAQDAQRARYRQVRQQREILSNLRERQLIAFKLEESRKTQQQIDELFLIRTSRGRGRRGKSLASGS